MSKFKPDSNRQRPVTVGSLSQKLSSLRSGIKTQKEHNFSLPAINQNSVDGVDHINIWERAQTELGLALCHKIDIKFDHPDFGRFKSVEGLWHWLRDKNRDDRHRQSHGPAAKRMAMNNDVIAHVENFKYHIVIANWVKVNSYPALVQMIAESTLPFEMYFQNDKNRIYVRPASAFWLIPAFEEIRNAIKENRQPDFDYLRDTRNDPEKQSKQERKNPAPQKAKISGALLEQIKGEKTPRPKIQPATEQSVINGSEVKEPNSTTIAAMEQAREMSSLQGSEPMIDKTPSWAMPVKTIADNGTCVGDFLPTDLSNSSNVVLGTHMPPVPQEEGKENPTAKEEVAYERGCTPTVVHVDESPMQPESEQPAQQ